MFVVKTICVDLMFWNDLKIFVLWVKLNYRVCINCMTTTFGPFSLVRPCKVLLTDLRIFNFVTWISRSNLLSFLPFWAWARPQLQWSGERGEDAITVSKVYKTPVALLPLQGRKYTFSFTFVKFGQKTWSRLVVLEQSHAQETGKHQPVDCLFFKSSFCWKASDCSSNTATKFGQKRWHTTLTCISSKLLIFETILQGQHENIGEY